MSRDLRYAWRLLRRSPGFTTTAIVTLALGIGANTAVFSVLEAVLLRPPAFRDANQLVVVQRYYPRKNQTVDQVSAPDWNDWKERSRTLAALAVYTPDVVSVNSAGGEPQRLPAAEISTQLPEILGVSPIIGHLFGTEDEQPKAAPTVLISERLWRERYSSNPAVLNETLIVQDVTTRIVGVMPAAFSFPEPQTSLWLPMRIAQRDLERRNVYYLNTLGRLKSGMPLADARADLSSVAAAVAREHPDTNTGQDVAVVTLQEYTLGNSKTLLLVLAGAVGFVLLLVCVNLVNLLLARSSARGSEFAVRAALGAGRRHVLRQLLAEGLLLSATGGAAGIVIAYWSIDAFRLLASGRFTRASEIRMDYGVLLFAVAVTFLCSLAFALVPAWSATPRSSTTASSRATENRSPIRAFLGTVEVAVAFVLLAGAGLMVQTLWRLQRVDPGFAKDNIVAFNVNPRMSQFKTRAQLAAFYEDMLAHIRILPGVLAAGAVGNIPLSGSRSGTGIAVENPPLARGQDIDANYQLAGPGYFSAMRIPLFQGRDFSSHDVGGAPDAVIVNRALAELCWPGQSAVGRHIRLGPDPKEPWSTVIGVIGNVRHDELNSPPRPEVYENYFQHAWEAMSIVVRHDAAAGVTAAIRSQIRLADPQMAIPAAVTMDQVIASSLRDRRFLMWVLLAFGACALLLAGVGIYGVIAYSVTRRTREIGVRVALGADRRDIARLVFQSGLRMAFAGVLTGGIAAVVLTRVLTSMLFGVSPADPMTLTGAALVLIAAAFLASFMPARRALRLEPLVALRHD